jgi:hypothetical protein
MHFLHLACYLYRVNLKINMGTLCAHLIILMSKGGGRVFPPLLCCSFIGVACFLAIFVLLLHVTGLLEFAFPLLLECFSFRERIHVISRAALHCCLLFHLS